MGSLLEQHFRAGNWPSKTKNAANLDEILAGVRTCCGPTGIRNGIRRSGQAGAPESSLQKLFHCWSRGAFERDISIALRRRGVSAAPMQIGEHRGPQVGAHQPLRRLEACENIESSGG